jgi:general secretion pathway protein F
VAIFAYRGVDAAGKKVSGVRDAENAKALRLVLRKDGVLVTEVLEESQARQKSAREVDFKKMLRRVSTLDIAVATRQLATLLKSGIPLVEALTALIDQLEQPDLKLALTQIRDRVNEGTSLHEAMRAHPKYFSTLYVNMVTAGESSGTLDAVLQRLAEFLEAQAKLSNKVFGALAYPMFMVLMGMGVVAVMMVAVVPKVTSIFENFQQALPWYTRLLIFTSDVFTGYWWLLILMVVGAVLGFRRWVATPDGRKRWDLFVLRAPIFGRLTLMVAVSRFARTLSTLLRSGVPLLGALEITRNVLGNTELMRVVEEARVSIREGESIAAPLKRSGRFPPIVTHMIAIGERSGQLEEMLENVASAYDNQVDAQIGVMTSLLEPIMILLVGGMSGGIAFAILIPLMQINEFVQ